MRTHRGFWVDTLRCIGWIALGTVVLITLLSLSNREHDPGPLPSTTVTLSVPADPVTEPAAATEDSKGWNCATQGNHICGPGSGHPAGCYNGGVLVAPWTNYTNPRLDPLWAQVNSPCADKLKPAAFSYPAHHVYPSRVWCATAGDLICETRSYRAAVRQLSRQPAMTLPGQWVRPAGRALVAECKQSYPNTLADKGVPNEELMICLTEPDPRKSDRRVITLAQAHRLHLITLHRLHMLTVARSK